MLEQQVIILCYFDALLHIFLWFKSSMSWITCLYATMLYRSITCKFYSRRPWTCNWVKTQLGELFGLSHMYFCWIIDELKM